MKYLTESQKQFVYLSRLIHKRSRPAIDWFAGAAVDAIVCAIAGVAVGAMVCAIDCAATWFIDEKEEAAVIFSFMDTCGFWIKQNK